MGKIAVWCQVVILCAVGGLGLGAACDGILWEWSYDYVFPDGYCRVQGLQLGFLVGTVVAVAAVLGEGPLLRWSRILVGWTTATLATALVAACVASAAWGGAKLSAATRTSDRMSPLSRAAFCSALVAGAGYGAWISAALWSFSLWKQRQAACVKLTSLANDAAQDPNGK